MEHERIRDHAGARHGDSCHVLCGHRVRNGQAALGHGFVGLLETEQGIEAQRYSTGRSDVTHTPALLTVREDEGLINEYGTQEFRCTH